MDSGPFLTDEDRLRSYREFVRRKTEGQRQYRARLKAQKEQSGAKRKYERRKPMKFPRPANSKHQDVQRKENIHQNHPSHNYDLYNELAVDEMPAASVDTQEEIIESAEVTTEEFLVVEEEAEELRLEPDACTAVEDYNEETYEPEEEITEPETIMSADEQALEDNEQQFVARRTNIIRLMDSLPEELRKYLRQVEKMLEDILEENEELGDLEPYHPRNN